MVKELILQANNIIGEECINNPCDECKFNKYIDNNGNGLCYTVSMLAGAYVLNDKLNKLKKER